MSHIEYDARDRSKAVATSTTLLLETNSLRRWVAFVNRGDYDVFLRFGEAAVADKGIYLKAKGGAFAFSCRDAPWFGEVHAIAITGASIVTVQEIEVKR